MTKPFVPKLVSAAPVEVRRVMYALRSQVVLLRIWSALPPTIVRPLLSTTTSVALPRDIWLGGTTGGTRSTRSPLFHAGSRSPAAAWADPAADASRHTAA